MEGDIEESGSEEGEESSDEDEAVDPLDRWERRLHRTWRKEFESSVAPPTSSESESESDGAGDSWPIRCATMQTDKAQGKRKPKEAESKKKVWENLEYNSSTLKDDTRVMPHPIILTVYVNGRECRALLDSGAFSDFISTTVVDSLGLKKEILPSAVTLQMVVQGSKSKINAKTTVDFSYATINCKKTFDIINIANYDMILGMPFYWQHKILAGMNPTRVAVGSNDPIPIAREEMHMILGAMAIKREESLQEIRDMLWKEAEDLCEDTTTSALPPFRAINHRIPLIDENKVYKYQPSKCPRALEPMWREKCGEYLRTGRWRVATGTNPIPILLVHKLRKNPGDPI